jgi:hypothetical protein
MGRVQKTGVLLLMCFATVVFLHELIHLDRYGHLVRFGLHADLVVSKGDIGLDGITKLYEARLTNYGLLPAKVTACDFTTDTSAHATKVAYTVEQWDSRQNKWMPVEYGEPPFCWRYPLGNVSEARLFSALLWPGQSIATGKEATAARGGFQIGDHARFSVFTGKVEDWRNAFPTPAFRIDEHVSSPFDVPGQKDNWSLRPRMLVRYLVTHKPEKSLASPYVRLPDAIVGAHH